MNERELIARLQKRDEAAFEELIRQYEKKVYTLCFRMCGNSEDAEEAAQDAFLALWRGIDRFRQESSLSTWIYRLATNACIDTLRRRKKQSGSVSLDDEELFVDAVDTSPQPQETVEHRETQKLLQEGLSALPEEYRKVLILREIEGLSYTEIAESASIELGTVKSRISRGRSLLRNFLSGNGNFFEIASSKVTECNREEMSAK
ncbi:MAG: sigma-70 family RNA polymerase sigma factor [Oscillospiraceae bacterium]|jgi:RNA polymerase sigma-70 factor (ECF subfamily)|nr:sigma-70 family RNA polymerase sigma factor [Oscillospiraceae bacterium]